MPTGHPHLRVASCCLLGVALPVEMRLSSPFFGTFHDMFLNVFTHNSGSTRAGTVLDLYLCTGSMGAFILRVLVMGGVDRGDSLIRRVS